MAGDIQITDVRVMGGGLVFSVEGAGVETLVPKKRHGQGIFNHHKFAWLQEPEVASAALELRRDGTEAHWPALGRTIRLKDLLAHATPWCGYRWYPERARAAATHAELVGCWRTSGGGLVLLRTDGKARVKHMSKGGGSELPGPHFWAEDEPGSFRLFERTERGVNRKTESFYSMVRFDGTTLQMSVRYSSRFSPDGWWVSPVLWFRSPPPKAWRES